MIEGKFNIVFAGRLAPGKAEDQVKQALAALFKTEVAQIERLFSGERVTIKRNLEYAQAMKYQAALKNAGALTMLQKVEDAQATSSQQPKQTAAVQNQASPNQASPNQASPNQANSGNKSSSESVVNTAPEASSTAAAVPATNTRTETTSTAQPTAELGNLTLASAGESIPNLERSQELLDPDTSHLSFDQSGDKLPPQNPFVEREVDTSSFSLSAAGEKIPNQPSEKEPVNPDISHLSLDS